jgi:hypothetical protein
MAFEPNVGQTATGGDFLARGAGYAALLAPTGLTLSLERGAGDAVNALRLEWAGGDPAAQPVALDRLPSVSNYLTGSDPSRWRAGVPNYARVRYEGVYEGVDVELRGAGRALEYDFVVAPGADPGPVRVRFAGAKSVRVAEDGGLVLDLGGGEVYQTQALVYQQTPEGERRVASRYVQTQADEVAFELEAFDATRPLVIDPVLTFVHYLAGSGQDLEQGFTVDASGSLYVTGTTVSADFPAPGGYDQTAGGAYDVFVSKLAPDGSSLVWSTYLGGSLDDYSSGLAVDALGAVYLTGYTWSADFPSTPGAYDTTHNGEVDLFAAKLNPNGASLAYATFVGTSQGDEGNAIALDPSGAVVIAGYTRSTSYPTTPGAFQTTMPGPLGADCVITKINATGTGLVFSTYLGGRDWDISRSVVLDGAGNIYVAGYTESIDFPTSSSAYDRSFNGGSDYFVTKMSPTGSALLYSTYIGSSSFDQVSRVAVNAAGEAFVVGTPASIGGPRRFPTTPGALKTTMVGGEASLTRLSADGSTLLYSTYIGGSDGDSAAGVAIDAAGNAYVTGFTQSADFPTTPDAFDATVETAYGDAWIAEVNPTGSALVYSTVMGGSRIDSAGFVAFGPESSFYVLGVTSSPDFPQVGMGPRGAYDLFVARFGTGPAMGGADTPGLAVPATGAWFLRNSNTSGPADRAFSYGPGASSLVALAGDWNGDRVDTVGLYDPAAGAFFLRDSASGGPADATFSFGAGGAGFMPLVGDWDGNGTDTVGLYDPATGTFFLRNANSAGPADIVFTFGAGGAGIVPLAGDWNGDGTATVGLYDPATGAFFLRNANAGGAADVVFTFGAGGAGFVPIVGEWYGDGTATPGLYDPATGALFLRNANAGGAADVVFTFGAGGAGLVPLAGDWDAL